jgi:hypothetical protein
MARLSAGAPPRYPPTQADPSLPPTSFIGHSPSQSITQAPSQSFTQTPSRPLHITQDPIYITQTPQAPLHISQPNMSILQYLLDQSQQSIRQSQTHSQTHSQTQSQDHYSNSHSQTQPQTIQPTPLPNIQSVLQSIPKIPNTLPTIPRPILDQLINQANLPKNYTYDQALGLLNQVLLSHKSNNSQVSDYINNKLNNTAWARDPLSRYHTMYDLYRMFVPSLIKIIPSKCISKPYPQSGQTYEEYVKSCNGQPYVAPDGTPFGPHTPKKPHIPDEFIHNEIKPQPPPKTELERIERELNDQFEKPCLYTAEQAVQLLYKIYELCHENKQLCEYIQIAVNSVLDWVNDHYERSNVMYKVYRMLF